MAVAMRQRRRHHSGAAAAVPVDQSFTYPQVAGGWTLLHDPSSNPGADYVLSSNSQALAAAWVGVITGQAAFIVMSSDYLPGREDLLRVSVDGGAYTSPGPPNGAGEYTLFSGLADGPHFVTFQVKGGNPEAPYAFMPTIGNVLRVFGTAPAIAPAGEWSMVGDANAKTVKPNGLIPIAAQDHYQAGRVPLNRAAWDFGAYSGTGRTGMQCLIALRTASTELWVVSQYRWLYLWDGATLNEYDTVSPISIGADAIRVKRITGLSGTKTYHLYGGATPSAPQGAWLAVGVPASSGLLPLTGTWQAHCFGDSITQGLSEQLSGRVELFRSFAKLGYAVGNFGVGGQDAAALDAALSDYLARLTVTANDVAYVAIGQNNMPTAPQISSIASQLVAKGYSRVIFRGVLPLVNGGHSAKNTVILAAISGLSDPKVKYIDPNDWNELIIQDATLRLDGIHPSASGHDYLMTKMDAALPAALA